MDDWPIDPLSPARALLLIVLIPLAVVLAIPIFVVTLGLALLTSLMLTAVGVPAPIPGLVLFVFGFGGGLAVLFVVLARLFRRFGPRVRKLTTPPTRSGVPRVRRDPSADPATIKDRVSALDAGLAPPEDRDKPYQ